MLRVTCAVAWAIWCSCARQRRSTRLQGRLLSCLPAPRCCRSNASMLALRTSSQRQVHCACLLGKKFVCCWHDCSHAGAASPSFNSTGIRAAAAFPDRGPTAGNKESAQGAAHYATRHCVGVPGCSRLRRILSVTGLLQVAT